MFLLIYRVYTYYIILRGQRMANTPNNNPFGSATGHSNSTNPFGSMTVANNPFGSMTNMNNKIDISADLAMINRNKNKRQ